MIKVFLILLFLKKCKLPKSNGHQPQLCKGKKLFQVTGNNLTEIILTFWIKLQILKIIRIFHLLKIKGLIFLNLIVKILLN